MIRRVGRKVRRLWRWTRVDCGISIHVRQWMLPAVLLALAVWEVVLPNAIAVTGLVTLGSLTLFSYLWVRSLAQGVAAQRTLRYSAVQVGDELEELLTLDNRSPTQ